MAGEDAAVPLVHVESECPMDYVRTEAILRGWQVDEQVLGRCGWARVCSGDGMWSLVLTDQHDVVVVSFPDLSPHGVPPSPPGPVVLITSMDMATGASIMSEALRSSGWSKQLALGGGPREQPHVWRNHDVDQGMVVGTPVVVATYVSGRQGVVVACRDTRRPLVRRVGHLEFPEDDGPGSTRL